MNQISNFNFAYFAILNIMMLNCAVCHEKSANVNQMRHGVRQLMDNDQQQLQLQQQYQYQKTSNEPNTDQRHANIFKDRFSSDQIVFDRGDVYETVNTKQTEDPPMAINNKLSKSNETNHHYVSKGNGEYEFSLTIRSGIRRMESGDFEEHNGRTVFVVRGFFEHITPDGIVKITAYAFDQTGYHEIPVVTDNEGVVDLYGPDQGHDCDFSKGVYCIDRKLLSLMVG